MRTRRANEGGRSSTVPVRHIDCSSRPLLRMHYCFGQPFRKLYTASGLNHSWAFIASYLANALLHSPGGLPTADKHTSASHARRASPVNTCACASDNMTALRQHHQCQREPDHLGHFHVLTPFRFSLLLILPAAPGLGHDKTGPSRFVMRPALGTARRLSRAETRDTTCGDGVG